MNLKYIRGQTIFLSLFFLGTGIIGLYFFLKVGGVMTTKSRLSNATDAAAYSAAIWRARVLNFHAYANRAIIVQEVSVAQAVTLAAWEKYFDKLFNNSTFFLSFLPEAGIILEQISNLSGYARRLTEWAVGTEIATRAHPSFGYKSLLQRSQEILNKSADVFGLGAVANEIIKSTDPSFFAFAVKGDSFSKFTRRYENDADRQRLRLLVEESLPGFVKGIRKKSLPLPLPSLCPGFSSNKNKWIQWWEKRGGTKLSLGLDRWEAIDTASIHSAGLPPFCTDHEVLPVAWGASETTVPIKNNYHKILNLNPGDTSLVNPIATMRALAKQKELKNVNFYSGIEKVRDLNYEVLSDDKFPTSRVLILGKASIKSSNKEMKTKYFKSPDRIWSLSLGEVYFKKPIFENKLKSRIEFASLYSPYWQARLAEVGEQERNTVSFYVH